jgi:predicted nucleotidyltransferase
MRRNTAPRRQLYLEEYPRLIRQIRRLVEMVRAGDPNVALLALFGSTARLIPHPSSDADLLVLVHDMRPFYPLVTGAQSAPVLELVREAEDAADEGDICRWPFSIVSGDVQGNDIDEEFLENVAAHGVLLYQQEGAAIPPVLQKLQPFSVWLEHVQSFLEEQDRLRAASAPAS